MFRRLLLVLVAVFLGFCCEAADWGEQVSSAFPFFIVFCLILGLYGVLAFNNGLPARGSLWLFVPPVIFAILACMTARQPDSLKYRLALSFTFLYLALLAMTYLGGQLRRYCMFDYLQNGRRLVVFIFQQPIQFGWQLIQDIRSFNQRLGETDRVSTSFAGKIGCLIFVALFGLFILADSVFQAIRSALENYWKGPWPEGPSALGIFLWSYLILGMLLYAATQSRDERLCVDDPREFRHWLNYNQSIRVFTAALIPLITYTVLRLYSSYYVNNLIADDGFPARVNTPFGFWELSTASALVFLLVCWLDHVTVFERENDRLFHTSLNLLLFVSVSVLLWVAGQSVSIHTIGLDTKQRVLYAYCALSWLWIMFAMFIGFEQLGRERDYPFYALCVTTGMVGVFCFIGALVLAL